VTSPRAVLKETNKMADDNTDSIDGNSDSDNSDSTPLADIEAQIAAAVEAKLTPIKTKLDAAYASRDQALEKLADRDQSDKDAELKRLQDEGKVEEALKLQIAELEAKNKVLESNNVTLTRDISVKDALGAVEFRNDKAKEMAFSEVVGDLHQDENGSWTPKDGSNLNDFVASFASNEANSFLMKPKENNGPGDATVPSGNSASDTPKSLFEMSQDEVIQKAAEGSLRTQQE
jgi:hypothetical protein